MTLSHRCTACGRSCHGVKVRLVSEAERERIEAAGVRLGVERPVVDGVLRQEDGTCVFQSADALCRIHAELGSLVKPHVCRQYPWVLVETEAGEQRVGIDPGCYTWPQTAHEAPTPIPEGLHGRRIPLPPQGLAMEKHLLDPAPTRVAEWAMRIDPRRDLAAWRARWVRTLRAMPIAELVGRPDAGRSLPEVFAPLLARIPHLPDDPGTPDDRAPDGVVAEADRVASETIRRVIHLRMMPEVPPFLAVELLLGGALARLWTDPADDRLTAAWCRASRAPVFASRWLDAWAGAARP
jgi:Fe-S-cluster containining protein